MGIYGKVEVEYYQLTPLGVQRAQSGTLPKLDGFTKGVFKKGSKFN